MLQRLYHPGQRYSRAGTELTEVARTGRGRDTAGGKHGRFPWTLALCFVLGHCREFQAPTSTMRNLRKFVPPARFHPLGLCAERREAPSSPAAARTLFFLFFFSQRKCSSNRESRKALSLWLQPKPVKVAGRSIVVESRRSAARIPNSFGVQQRCVSRLWVG